MQGADTNGGVRKVQADLDAASNLNDDWLMKLNDRNCGVVHMGKRDPKAKYTIRKSGASELGGRKGFGS